MVNLWKLHVKKMAKKYQIPFNKSLALNETSHTYNIQCRMLGDINKEYLQWYNETTFQKQKLLQFNEHFLIMYNDCHCGLPFVSRIIYHTKIYTNY